MSTRVFIEDGYTIGSRVYLKGEKITTEELQEKGLNYRNQEQQAIYGKVFHVPESRFDEDMLHDAPEPRVPGNSVVANLTRVDPDPDPIKKKKKKVKKVRKAA